MFKKSKFSPGSLVWIAARHSPGTEQTIDSQLKGLETYCTGNQLIVADRFVDAGISGDSRGRGEFSRLLNAIWTSKKPLVTGVIFWESARVGRD